MRVYFRILAGIFVFALAVGGYGAKAQQAEGLYLDEEKSLVGLFAGYLPGGPVDVGFVGSRLTTASRYDVAVLYGSSPKTSTFGLQAGKLFVSQSDSTLNLQARLGGNFQVVELDAGGDSFSTTAFGVSFTTGIPFQSDGFLLRPTGTFALSFFTDANVQPLAQPSVAGGVAVGAQQSSVAFLVQPLVSVPLAGPQEEASYGVSAALAFVLD